MALLVGGKWRRGVCPSSRRQWFQGSARVRFLPYRAALTGGVERGSTPPCLRSAPGLFILAAGDVMERDICESRHGGNEESAEAFLSSPAGHKARQRFVIWNIAVCEGSRGVTTDEIAARLKTTPNVISGRMSELKRDGFLTATEQRRPTRMGRMARVFVAYNPAP